MAILSLDELNNAVDEVYGKKPKTAQDIIAPKKSSMTTFNPTQPMADAVTQTSSTPETVSYTHLTLPTIYSV